MVSFKVSQNQQVEQWELLHEIIFENVLAEEVSYYANWKFCSQFVGNYIIRYTPLSVCMCQRVQMSHHPCLLCATDFIVATSSISTVRLPTMDESAESFPV